MTTRPDFEEDERHFLYVQYLKILADYMPPVFVMENVKGLLSATHDGSRIVDKIFRDLKDPSKAIKGRSSGQGYKLFSLCHKVSPDGLEPSDFIVKAEEYGIPQARHRLLILGIRDDLDITPETLAKEQAPTVSDVIGDLPKIRSTLSKEQDDFDLWKHVLASASDETWYKRGKANGLPIA